MKLNPLKKSHCGGPPAVRVLSITDKRAFDPLVLQQNITVHRVFTNLE